MNYVKTQVGKMMTALRAAVSGAFLPRDQTPKAWDTSRYSHVSVPMTPIDSPDLRHMLGVDYMAGKGVTYNAGRNQLKRNADAMGKNNKERRRIRRDLKRRVDEIMGGAP